MNTEWRLISSMTAAALALAALPTAAGAQSEGQANNEISIFAGRVLGDDLTETPVSGRVPQLDDDGAVTPPGATTPDMPPGGGSRAPDAADRRGAA